MSYQGQDPNQQGQYPPNQQGQYPPNQQGQYPGSGQYGGGYVPPQPQPTDPYSGQQYGQPQGGPYGQTPYGTPPSGPSSMNIEPNVAAGLSYLTWIAGLIFFLSEKRNRFVRFHAMQSIIFTGSCTVLWIAVSLVGSVIPLLYGTLFCIMGLVLIAAFVVWIICLINAFQGKYFKLPVIGDYAERYANQGVV